jgi:hypothetical protein
MAAIQLPGEMTSRAVRSAKRSCAVAVAVATLSLQMAMADANGPISSGAATRKERSVATVVLREWEGNRLRYRGKTTSRIFGRGTLSISGKLRNFTLSAAFTGHYPRGDVRGTAKVSGRPDANGRMTFIGTARITGGTGSYVGITGRGRLRGNGPLDLSSATLHQRGIVRY